MAGSSISIVTDFGSDGGFYAYEPPLLGHPPWKTDPATSVVDARPTNLAGRGTRRRRFEHVADARVARDRLAIANTTPSRRVDTRASTRATTPLENGNRAHRRVLDSARREQGAIRPGVGVGDDRTKNSSSVIGIRWCRFSAAIAGCHEVVDSCSAL